MKRNGFLAALDTGGLLFLDGAMGTMLQAAGMPAGTSPEQFCLQNPSILKNIHSAYLAAGSNIITTCTFGANPFKMPPGLDVYSFNKEMALVAREAIKESGREGPVCVAGDVGPTGKFARPLGDVAPEALIEAFAIQIEGLAAGGVDVIFMETQFDLAEVRAAVVACRRVCDLPVMVSMTFEHGTSLTGSTPEIFAETTQNLGCDAIGTNCSLGPQEMKGVVEDLLTVCSTPVLAEPNAGLPQLKDGKTVFPLPPGPFAEHTSQFARMGVQILGGCCGTTPEHISALVQACSGLEFRRHISSRPSGIVLTSRSKLVRIGPDQPLALIGERINPTGKKKLTQELQNGDLSEAALLAGQQIQAGANILDVNTGAPLVDEKRILPELASLLISRFETPLSLDSSDREAIAAALPYYPGSCLVNSISGEPGKMEALAPLCRIFGAPAILLPLTGAKLPLTATERIAILVNLLAEAEKYGLNRHMVMVDALALAVSANNTSGRECLQVLRWCREQKLATTIGLSNISFGLPARNLLNATFMALATGAGLTSCIANPSAPRVSEAIDSIHALMGDDRDCESFISNYKEWQTGQSGKKGVTNDRKQTPDLFTAITAGDRENILPVLEQELKKGREPFAIVNETLIPAITEVGTRYEKREYFLPQLIRSAETMQKAFAYLQPYLAETGNAEKRPVIVMATVEGDIHDIGKNIVSLLLGNHGFEVIDAGKDVPAEKILECAKKNGASLIGLSALMTTTMVRMSDTIDLIKKNGLPIKVMVGGAAVTKDFAESIGADAYCEDAVAAVAAARALLVA